MLSIRAGSRTTASGLYPHFFDAPGEYSVLNLLVLSYIEIESGKALTSLMAERTGISSRTWLRGGPKRVAARTRARASSRASLHNELVSHGWSKEVDRLISEHPQSLEPRALYAGLVYSAQYPGIAEFPQTLALARIADRVSASLWEARAAGNLVAFRSGADLNLDTEQVLGRGTRNLERLRTAHDWNAADNALGALAMDVLVSLFATWDVELCSRFFSRFEPLPIFSLLLPQLRQPAGVADFKHEGRAAVRLPTRRLIDLTTCLAHYVRHGRWTAKPMAVKQLAAQVKETEQLVKDWRRGRLFTRPDYAKLWEHCCRKPNEEQTRVPVPMPLYVAATMWQMTLVGETGPRQSPWLIERAYVAAWQRRLREARAKGVVFGSTPWPACVSRV